MSYSNFTIEDLLNSGIHYGHNRRRWNPKMKQYIYTTHNNVHIIDLRKTAPLLINALKKIEEVVASNGRVLFVGTKPQASEIVAEYADVCGQYYINHRWLGGTLTNWKTISNSIRTLEKIEKIMEEGCKGLVKKERLSLFRKQEKLNKALSGVRKMGGAPDLVVVLDAHMEKIAIQEAKKLNIPVVGVVDTNANPYSVDYPIPGNDDSVKSIRLYCDLMSKAVLKGLAVEEEAIEQELGNKQSITAPKPEVASVKTEAKAETKTEEKKVATPKTEKKLTSAASLVKELREKTGAGMLDCKNALKENNNDIEASVEWLRKKGITAASKKSDRIASEGVVAVSNKDKNVVMIEVNSETDFVARNEDFQAFVGKVLSSAHGCKTLEDLQKATFEGSETVEDATTKVTATIGEKISLRRLFAYEGKENVFTYVHNKVADSMGSISVVVDVKGENAKEVGDNIALHIAAYAPLALSSDKLSEDDVEKEKNVQRELALNSGKPADVVEKMLDGRMKKFYAEVCLLEQKFIADPDKTVAQVLKDAGCEVVDYKMFKLGEGLEKKQENFAEEVAKAIK